MLTLEQAIAASGKKVPKAVPMRITQAMIDKAHECYSFPKAAGCVAYHNRKTGMDYRIKAGEDGEVVIDMPDQALAVSSEEINRYVSEFVSANKLMRPCSEAA